MSAQTGIDSAADSALPPFFDQQAKEGHVFHEVAPEHAAQLTPNALLWTLDKGLDALAARWGIAYKPASP